MKFIHKYIYLTASLDLTTQRSFLPFRFANSVLVNVVFAPANISAKVPTVPGKIGSSEVVYSVVNLAVNDK